VDLLQSLEQKVDELLDRYRTLLRECRELRSENSRLQDERKRYHRELDAVIAKLDRLERSES